MKFEWDENKNRLNLAKHGVNFDTALAVFDDPYALIEQDRFVDDEERWQAVGLIDAIRMIVVAHTLRGEADGEEIVRIISARPAERFERRIYDRARLGAH